MLISFYCIFFFLQGTDGEPGEKGEDGEGGQPVSSSQNFILSLERVLTGLIGFADSLGANRGKKPDTNVPPLC